MTGAGYGTCTSLCVPVATSTELPAVALPSTQKQNNGVSQENGISVLANGVKAAQLTDTAQMQWLTSNRTAAAAGSIEQLTAFLEVVVQSDCSLQCTLLLASELQQTATNAVPTVIGTMSIDTHIQSLLKTPSATAVMTLPQSSGQILSAAADIVAACFPWLRVARAAAAHSLRFVMSDWSSTASGVWHDLVAEHDDHDNSTAHTETGSQLSVSLAASGQHAFVWKCVSMDAHLPVFDGAQVVLPDALAQLRGLTITASDDSHTQQQTVVATLHSSLSLQADCRLLAGGLTQAAAAMKPYSEHATAILAKQNNSKSKAGSKTGQFTVLSVSPYHVSLGKPG